jgi:hypothetical protein
MLQLDELVPERKGPVMLALLPQGPPASLPLLSSWLPASF